MSEVRKPLSKIDDYPAYLESCWQEHLLPRSDNAPTVISLFAGCGGSSLGYSMAGFRELLAVEWDDNAVETFKLNFTDIPVYHGDIHDCSVDWILETTGLKSGELDILDGSPPCQGFSTAGKRHITDSRNQLYGEYVRILRGLQPKVFVMENVSGMIKGKMKLIFADIMRELKASGYNVSARLLNAMYFGVPQSRERMIFIGTREDLGIEPSHPWAESIPCTVNQAWKNINNNTFARPLANIGQKVWNGIKEGQSGTSYRKGYYFGSAKPSFDKPAPTLQKSFSGIGGMLHPSEKRSITIEEGKRIGSFPDQYKLIFGSYTDKYARIGNSVPPLFMRSIAKHIRQEILDRIPCS